MCPRRTAAAAEQQDCPLLLHNARDALRIYIGPGVSWKGRWPIHWLSAMTYPEDLDRFRAAISDRDTLVQSERSPSRFGRLDAASKTSSTSWVVHRRSPPMHGPTADTTFRQH